MQNIICRIFLLSIFSLITDSLFCQDMEQPLANASMRDSLIGVYRNSLGRAEQLYTGSEYLGYVKRPKGHPFFLLDQFQPATLLYQGAIYRDSILYDLVDDAVIIRDPTGEYNINIVKDKIRWFRLRDHQFIRVDSFANASIEIPSGYYEEVYNGALHVLVGHRKQINSKTVQSEVQSEYAQYDSYFIRKGDKYFRIVNLNTLLDALSEHRNEVRHFMHQQNLNFKKDPVNSLQRATAFYDEFVKHRN